VRPLPPAAVAAAGAVDGVDLLLALELLPLRLASLDDGAIVVCVDVDADGRGVIVLIDDAAAATFLPSFFAVVTTAAVATVAVVDDDDLFGVACSFFLRRPVDVVTVAAVAAAID
jgi:hypothetical protein